MCIPSMTGSEVSQKPMDYLEFDWRSQYNWRCELTRNGSEVLYANDWKFMEDGNNLTNETKR